MTHPLLPGLSFVHPRNQSPVIPIQNGTPGGRFLYHSEIRDVSSRGQAVPHLFLMMSAVPQDIPAIVDITRQMWTNRYNQLEINADPETYAARMASHPHGIIGQYAIPLSDIDARARSYIQNPAECPFNDLDPRERNLFLKTFLQEGYINCAPLRHMVGAISVIRKELSDVCADPQLSWNCVTGTGNFETHNPEGRIAVCPEVSARPPGTGWAIIQNGVTPMAGFLGLDGALPYSVCRDLGHVVEAICRTMTGVSSRISRGNDGTIRIGRYGVLEFGDQGDITLRIQNPLSLHRRDIERGKRIILLDAKRFYLPRAVKRKIQEWACGDDPNAVLRWFLTSPDRRFAAMARRVFNPGTPIAASRRELKRIIQDILMTRVQPGLEIDEDPDTGRVGAGPGHFELTRDGRIIFEFDRAVAVDQQPIPQAGDRHFLLNVRTYLSCQNFDQVIGFHQNNGARLMRIVIGGRADAQNSDIVNSLGISPLLFYSIPRPLPGGYPGTVMTIPWIPETPPVVRAGGTSP